MKWNLAVMDYLVTVQEMGLGPSMTDTSSCEENNTTYDDYHNLLFLLLTLKVHNLPRLPHCRSGNSILPLA